MTMSGNMLLWGIGVLLPALVNSYSAMNEVSTFFSRPDLTPPKFEFTTLNKDLVAPGYILMAPYTPLLSSSLAAGSIPNPSTVTPAVIQELLIELGEAIQNGPYVFDQSGNLVYSGYGSCGGQYAHDVRVVEFDGSLHLTYSAGNDGSGGNRAHGVIQNSHYHTVQTVSSGFGRAPNDIHEFTVLDTKTALITIFQPSRYDLSSYGLKQPYGWVIEGIFQEIDISSGEVLFEWRSLDHSQSSPANTYNAYGSNGTSTGSAVSQIWDYFHINAVDKDSLGNYIVSSRYLCALFYINGTDGSILWQLNGMQNGFTFVGFDNNAFPFSFQHNPRILSQNGTITTLSLFDNGSDGYRTFQNSSAAMIIAVDTSTMTCTLLNQYRASDSSGKAILSTSQGAAQVLDNGNVFVGWGSSPYISEFAADGTLVMQGQFGAANAAQNYRAVKSHWVGRPDSTPAIWSYAASPSSGTTFYTSWNGATGIARWQFFGGADQTSMTLLGSAIKTGFETNFTSSTFVAWGYAQALGGNGQVLGTSPVQRTFVSGLNQSNSTGVGNSTLKYRRT